MAGKLKPLDVERKIRPGKFCASWEGSGVNPCPDRTGLCGMGAYGTALSNGGARTGAGEGWSVRLQVEFPQKVAHAVRSLEVDSGSLLDVSERGAQRPRASAQVSRAVTVSATEYS
jgi:hypothetical protein